MGKKKRVETKHETVTVVLPAFLASALVNGDTSGLDGPKDEALLHAALKYCKGYSIVDVGEPYFSPWCDADEVGPFVGDVAEYTLLKY
jgi:hypothetical protein